MFLLYTAEILPPPLRCVCLDDKERWSPQQLLKHSFINPQPKMPLVEQSPEGEFGLPAFPVCLFVLIGSHYVVQARPLGLAASAS